MKFKSFICAVLFLLLASAPICAASTDIATVEKQISEYDASSGNEYITIANNVMQLFHEAKITDEAMKFEASTPRDSVNQQVWYWASEYFYAHQAYPQALKYGLQALPLCNNDEDRANYLSLISLIYFRQSNYEQAANYAKQCYKLDEKSGDPDVMSSSLNTLARPTTRRAWPC